jgi:outer membrane protein
MSLIVLAGLGVASTAAAEDLKIGYVDLHRALNETEEGQKAKQALKKEIQAKQKRLNKKKKKIKQLKKELQSQAMALSKKAKRKKQKQLRRRMSRLQRMYLKLQRKLTKKEATKTKELFDEMRGVVEKIAEEKGYDLVLEKGKTTVLYGKDAIDLTDELIERYENDDGGSGSGDGGE